MMSRLSAAEAPVWQIGIEDNSYRELAIAGNYQEYPATFPKDVSFHVGKHDPKSSWSFIQPGPSDSWAGGHSHSFEIIFTLSEQPKGVYPLIIDLADTHGTNPPVLRVSVNGSSGAVQLPKGNGDPTLTNPFAGKEYVLRLDLPAGALRKGENKVVLSTTAGSWLLYDCVRLLHDQSRTPSFGIKRLDVHPTIRYAKGEPEKQIVEIEAEFDVGSPRCFAEVKLGDQSLRLALRPPLFGTLKQEIAVPAVDSPTHAEIAVLNLRKEWTQKPERRWLLYVQPSSHVDIGYTDLQEKVADLHNRNTSLAINLCKKYPGFVWNTEAAWVQDNYLSMMSEHLNRLFIDLARQGRIGCQAMYGNMLTGICSHESLIRSLYYAYSQSRKHGIPFDIAMISDVPTYVGTLPTFLAGAGIKYFSAGLNLTRAHSFNTFFDKSPFYWQGPDGSKVLTWFADSYAKATTTGLTSDLEKAKKGVEAFLRRYDREDYPYDAVLAFGGYWDNQPLREEFAKTVDEWNKRYAYPRIILCRGPEFFEYVEKTFAELIPSYKGDAGVYWEDGAVSSARETALVRQAKEDLLTAEKLYSLAGVSYPYTEFQAAWRNAILFDEHTWGAHCSVTQPRSDQTVRQWMYKAQFAHDVANQSKALVRSGLTALSAQIKTKDDSILVVNPLNVAISGLVRAVDKWRNVFEFWADEVPSVGYKVFPLSGVRNEASFARTGAVVRQNNSGRMLFENAYYRLELDPATGKIESLYDKQLSRELVDQSSPFGLNQYIYVSGYGKDMRIHGEQMATIVKWERQPYRMAIRVKTSAYMTPEVVSEIVLWDRIKRIDFNNTLRKKGTLAKEAGYFVFPFACRNPKFEIEIPGGVIQPDKDMFPGACMQWYCVQDFVAVSDDGLSIVWTPIDSPLVTLCDVNRESFASPLPITNGHLYAYVFNNYWFTNYKASQSGRFIFRFSLTSMSRPDALAASSFGRSVRNPLRANFVSGTTKRIASSPTAQSLVSLLQNNAVIQTVKPAEHCEGLVIRIREVTGGEVSTAVTLPPGTREVWSCNLVEKPISRLVVKNGKCNLWLKPYQIITLLAR